MLFEPQNWNLGSMVLFCGFPIQRYVVGNDCKYVILLILHSTPVFTERERERGGGVGDAFVTILYI